MKTLCLFVRLSKFLLALINTKTIQRFIRCSQTWYCCLLHKHSRPSPKGRFADCRHSSSKAWLTSQCNCLGSNSTKWWCLSLFTIFFPFINPTLPLRIWISPGSWAAASVAWLPLHQHQVGPVLLGLQGCLSQLLQATGSLDPTWAWKIPGSHGTKVSSREFPPFLTDYFLAFPQSVWSYFIFKSQQEPNLDPMKDVSVQHISSLTLKGKTSFRYSPPMSHTTLKRIQIAAVLMCRRPLTRCLPSLQAALC